ncbi:MAG: methionine--tRNA ligase [Kistimonas sp.]|nr:methionine--tRNA ligase [Kistimonas sp.]
MSQTDKDNSSSRKMLVTSALPYANGPLHMGHLVEYIQSDIWVRFQKMRGHACTFVCADDAHGTAISLYAQKQGITPEASVAAVHEERMEDFRRFLVDFDNYHSTHSEENRTQVAAIYNCLKEKGHIVRRTITQAFDPVSKRFLADRYVKGTCPRCGAADQYGDNCESCSATYSPAELINPRSTVSGATPVERESEHLFFRLSDFSSVIRSWIDSGTIRQEIANKLSEWLDAGLQDWDISRDAPYFGFQIPGETDKYFYVWLDAPVGYMAAFRNLCDRTEGLDFDAFWKPDSDAELHHFIGKDIINFHCLFWPAMLSGAGYRTPTKVHVHGYLTINGEKMSKSRGTLIAARTWLDHLGPESLRYYYAARLSGRMEDLDLNTSDLVQRINSDLVGKLVNIASRNAGFITKRFDGRLSSTNAAPELLDACQQAAPLIASLYEELDFARAMRKVMSLADKANSWIDEVKPWVIARTPGEEDRLQAVCSVGINVFRLLMIYLAPVLPAMAKQAAGFLNTDSLRWDDSQTLLLDHSINTFTPLMKRIEQKQIDAVLEQARVEALSQQSTASSSPVAPAAASAVAGEKVARADEIGIDDFSRIDLRVARIVDAQPVEGADKLLRLTLDLDEGRTRTAFSGIRKAYQPQDLIGRHTLVVANLKPRRMRFGVSEVMVLTAGSGGENLWLVQPDAGARPGMPVS